MVARRSGRPRTAAMNGGLLLALALLLGGWGSPARAGSLGSQRAGTSAGTFLKIGVGARAAAMGRAAVAQVGDPASLFLNPAGLADLEGRAVFVERIEWLADVNMTAAGLAGNLPWGGVVGLSAISLASELEETTTLAPDGTGRSFSHRDLALGATYARHLTDRFSLGLTTRLIYEALGTEIGGPSATTWVVDMGTAFNTGFRGMTLAMAIESFGPDLTPAGSYVDPRPNRGSEVEFSGFSPPTTFRLGSSYLAWAHATSTLNLAGEFVRPADNDETLRFGAELSLYERLDIRGGWDGSSNALPWSGGAGVRFPGERWQTHIDYAFSSSEFFSRVDRVSLRIDF